MPIELKIPERSVQLTSETRPIIDMYKAALTSLQLEESDADANEPQLRKGFWATYVTQFREALTQAPYGALAVRLDEIELELQVPAEFLLRSYLMFLNSILETQKLDAEDTEAEEITSKYALTRELLYRLVAIAMSNKLDHQRDGDKLIAALKSFVARIKQSEALVEKPRFFGAKTNSVFLEKLSMEHPQWISQIEQMTLIIKTINSNVNAISNTLNWLRSAEQTIQRQLIAYLDDQTDQSKLVSEWLDSTLENCEHKLLALDASSERNVTDLILKNGLDLSEHQQNLLSRLPNTDRVEIKRKKMAELYHLLNESNFLSEILAHLDLLMTYTSWMPILAGVIRFDRLSNLMKNYNSRYTAVLEIPDEFKDIRRAPVARALVKFDALNGNTIDGTGQIHLEALNNLQSNILKKRIGSLIVSAVSSLVRLQSKLPGTFHFINAEKTQSWLLQYRPIPAQVVKLREELEDYKNTTTVSNIKVSDLTERVQRLEEEIANTTQSTSAVLAATTMLHRQLIHDCKSLEVLEMLKNNGADLTRYCSQQNPFRGYTALHIAASTDNIPACKWILSCGVDVNVLDSGGDTPLDKAVKRSLYQTIKFLKENGGNGKQVEKATQKIHDIIDDLCITASDDSVLPEHIHQLSDLVSHGADIDGVNKSNNAWHGDRPLHTLFVKRNKRLIQWFLGMGANPTLLEPRHQETPYMRLNRVCPEEYKASMNEFLERYYPDIIYASKQLSAGQDSDTSTREYPNRFFPVQARQNEVVQQSDVGVNRANITLKRY